MNIKDLKPIGFGSFLFTWTVTEACVIMQKKRGGEDDDEKKLRFLLPFLLGAAYGLVLTLLTSRLITGAWRLAAPVAKLLQFEEVQEVALALQQLESARIQLPWLAIPLLGAAGVLLAWLLRRCRRKPLLSTCAALVLAIPVTMLLLAFTTINGIRPANILLSTEQSREYPAETYVSSGETWHFGFGSREILLPDDVALALLPGEIFPELVLDGSYGSAFPQQENPTPLREIAALYGVEQLIVVGLADDEVGYIVPPSDFLVNPDWPYFDKIVDATGENHYEETNSVGPQCAVRIAEAFTAAFRALAE